MQPKKARRILGSVAATEAAKAENLPTGTRGTGDVLSFLCILLRFVGNLSELLCRLLSFLQDQPRHPRKVSNHEYRERLEDFRQPATGSTNW